MAFSSTKAVFFAWFSEDIDGPRYPGSKDSIVAAMGRFKIGIPGVSLKNRGILPTKMDGL